MGIKGLYDYLKKKYKHKLLSYEDLSGKLFYVDLSIYVYKYTCIKINTKTLYRRLHLLQTGEELDPAIVPNVHEILLSSTPENIDEAFREIVSERVQEMIEWQITKFRKYDIVTPYIVDGPTHPLKEKTTAERKKMLKKTRDEVETVLADAVESLKISAEACAESQIESTTISQITGESVTVMIVNPTVNPLTAYVEKLCKTPQAYIGKWIFDIAEAKLKSLGVKLIYAPHDSEAYGSWLTCNVNYICNDLSLDHVENHHTKLDCGDEICNHHREVFGLLTEDSDTLTFGAKNLLRLDKDGMFQVYNIHDILMSLGISQLQFVDMCICMGCDYTNGVAGVGPIGAHKQLMLDGVIKGLSDIPLYDEIVAYFTHVE